VIRVHWRAGLADVLRLLHAEHRGARLLLLLMLRLLVPLAPRSCAEWSARGWRTKHSRFRAHALAAKNIYFCYFHRVSSTFIMLRQLGEKELMMIKMHSKKISRRLIASG
jgi:hypothetical protein